jgi:hypothetical protein
MTKTAILTKVATALMTLAYCCCAAPQKPPLDDRQSDLKIREAAPQATILCWRRCLTYELICVGQSDDPRYETACHHAEAECYEGCK